MPIPKDYRASFFPHRTFFFALSSRYSIVKM